ncbi:MAG: hypothetical protein LQ337_004131 [Flavoplaca oasis]|nr:MAG: hypothetical protein LQ337_004131 [Flavoplaca oasis]
MSASKQSPSTGIVSQLKGPLLKYVIPNIPHFPRRLRLCRQLVHGLVTIKLEPCNSTFYIHKGLLCHHSPVFKAMLEHDWKEKQEGVATLKDEDHGVFQRFVLWLYYGGVLDKDETVESIPIQTLVDCYLLADRRDVPEMRNQVIDTIFCKAKAANTVFSGFQRYIWKNTPESSPLRRLLVDMMVLRGNLEKFLENENKENVFDKSFIVDVCIRKYRNPNLLSWEKFYEMRCEYHIHNERAPACSS